MHALASFGLEQGDVGSEAMGWVTLSELAGVNTISDLGVLRTNSRDAGEGVELRLGMLEGLEGYANQATEDDAMDGLNFGNTADFDMAHSNQHGDNLNLNLGNDQHQQESNATSANGDVAGGGAGGEQNFRISNEDLNAALNMSMDQSTSFDSLLDNMVFGGGTGEEGEGGRVGAWVIGGGMVKRAGSLDCRRECGDKRV